MSALLLLVAAPCFLPTSGHAQGGSAADSVVDACLARDTSKAWKEVLNAWGTDEHAEWTNDPLRARLLSLEASDQAVRQGTALADSMSDPAYARRMLMTDSANLGTMREILRLYGWPTRSMVGPSGARAAFVVLQHLGPLQHDALKLIRALPLGEASPTDVAMLEDRIRVSDGQPQLFGSQISWGPDREPRFDPIEDIGQLDARRAAAGLPPMDVYLCMIKGLYGRDVADPRKPH